ncbi:hypothetical protein D2T29_12720 [Sinirhodobacter populi]|uniref:Uncharacterized protein n=1 Tax=Paenirhodobacter populi TaxID=2306993 RepID=A0A443KCL0_9RHOB|nr:hypothetical protein [Sinirhodobacter populi]RWR30528.1 hypothetical protein D2T29_12720 [Sinirhodobacter populi]
MEDLSLTSLLKAKTEITDTMIEAGAQALRERQQAGRITREWGQLPNSDKRKWREHAEAVLRAALGKPN